jgi:hypothetical protein
VSGDCRYNWLAEVLAMKIFSDLMGGNVSIHHWHIAIHEDEFIRAGSEPLNVCNYLAQCILAV